MILLRTMTWLSLRLGRPVARCVLHGIAAYYFMFAPQPRRHARVYLRRALGREPTALDRYRHLLSFATTIHDRLYLINGRYDLFDISLEGEGLLRARLRQHQGVFLMGAHLGSFEVVHALARRQPGLSVAMAMYEHNAQKINAMLAAINPTLSPDIIALGNLNSMLRIRARLEQGTCVGVLGDRTLGAEPAMQVSFLGAPAAIPTSAMRAAAMLRCRVVFMTGLYRGSNRYHIVFTELADFSETSAPTRETAIRTAIRRYAALLEQHCQRDPYNWFNFFDFWNPQQLPEARHEVRGR